MPRCSTPVAECVVLYESTVLWCTVCIAQGNAELQRDKLRRLVELGATVHNSTKLRTALSQQANIAVAKPPLPDKTGKPFQDNATVVHASTNIESLTKLEPEGSVDPSAFKDMSDEELKGLLDRHRKLVASLEEELARRQKS